MLSELEDQGFGFRLLSDDGQQYETINHVIFADDVWIIARSDEELHFLLRKTTDALLRGHLAWKQDEKMTVSYNKHVLDRPVGPVTVGTGNQLFTFAQTSAVECLGGMIDINGVADVLLEGRIEAMNAHFWQRARQLKNKRIPLSIRLHRYVQTVRRTGLYLAGSHTWTQRMARRFLAAEAAIVRRIWAPKKLTTELWQEWQARTMRGARLWLLWLGVPNILQEALTAHHRWSGHVARMDQSHFTRKCSNWRNTSWWKTRQEDRQVWDTANRTGWRHYRRGPTARWDTAITRICGTDWQTRAAERELWKEGEVAYVTKRHGELVPPRAGSALPASDTPPPEAAAARA